MCSSMQTLTQRPHSVRVHSRQESPGRFVGTGLRLRWKHSDGMFWNRKLDVLTPTEVIL